MKSIHVLAPYSTHAELAVREERAFGRWVGHDIHAHAFYDLRGIKFSEGDIVMIRGLRSIQSVARMKSFTEDFITQAMYHNLTPVLIGLDNYELKRPSMLVLLDTITVAKDVYNDEVRKNSVGF